MVGRDLADARLFDLPTGAVTKSVTINPVATTIISGDGNLKHSHAGCRPVLQATTQPTSPSNRPQQTSPSSAARMKKSNSEKYSTIMDMAHLLRKSLRLQ
jgi:hypothetical protein